MTRLYTRTCVVILNAHACGKSETTVDQRHTGILRINNFPALLENAGNVAQILICIMPAFYCPGRSSIDFACRYETCRLALR